jgi:hypothetical protein
MQERFIVTQRNKATTTYFRADCRRRRRAIQTKNGSKKQQGRQSDGAAGEKAGMLPLYTIAPLAPSLTQGQVAFFPRNFRHFRRLDSLMSSLLCGFDCEQ